MVLVLFSAASSARMAATALSFHLYTLYLFTKSDIKTLIFPVVRMPTFSSCPLFRFFIHLFGQHDPVYLPRLFSPRPPLRRAVPLVSSIPYFGCGFIVYSLDSQIRRSHARSQKTSLTIPSGPFRPVVSLSDKHARYAG